ncbi:Dimethyl sulfoxide/trimethylamine N-oxide reductase [Paraburkholderia nemoris]|uniref:molybdopterin-dependent oxidoreductase n=1 Tax=Paraburkholderia nemoris TaxID=2793076 RepID=UPI00191467C2|nr:molybdopterin-dependent oxidoreductase [Paraburkholderia nemoris]MBK5151371.1 molybdopterin-dependent oxidoreductase [Burkholderia sp. R-69608]CAE6952059.1 Dimethyl sulfoxide/trimethylamine N-oxide reductase [Paraburkholderia nemoris]
MPDPTLIQTASHWGVYDVHVNAGEIVGVSAFGQDPGPTNLMHSLPQMVRSPLRIDQPYVRAGYLKGREASRAGRGCEPFVPVSWDTALDLVEHGLRKVKADYGNDAIYGGSYGWASAGRLHHSPSVLKKFLGLFGGYVDKRGNHSFGAAMHITPYVVGSSDVTSMVVPWQHIAEHAELVVMFGGAHVKNMQLDPGGAVMHETEQWINRIAGSDIRFINISPSKDNAPDALDADWLPIVPNTDTAMMLGIAHVLVAENLYDAQFLATYCEGFEPFRRYLMGVADGVPKDHVWASRICGINAETIRGLARQMAAHKTLVTTAWSVQRADHGEQPVWMTVVLASLLGRVGEPGCGFSLGFGGVAGIAVRRPKNIPRPTFSLGSNPVRSYVPVGRVADMLLNPGSAMDYNGTTLQMPDIKLIYSVGGNPFHHNANLNRFVQAWRQPEFVVVHEPWWCPPAKYADVVLPATTTMERNDILATEFQRHWVAMYQVIPPVAQSRNDFDVFAELSDRMGFKEAYTEGRGEMEWLRHMYGEARSTAYSLGYEPPTFDSFWADGSFEFPSDEEKLESPMFAAFRGDPVAHPLKTPSGKIEIFSHRIAEFCYDDCPPHPAWLEPAEWLGGELAKKFPLHLLSNQPAGKLHSQLDAGPVSTQFKQGGREVLSLSERDAAARGISDGDVVKVFNDRGAFLASAKIKSELMEGVAQIATGAWFDPEDPAAESSLEKHGNPNVVTLDKGTSRLGQGSVAQTVLVQVEKSEEMPAVTAFDLPCFVTGESLGFDDLRV